MKVHLVLCKLNLQLEATVALRAIAQCLAHALVFQPLYVCCPARSVEPKKRILKLFDVFFSQKSSEGTEQYRTSVQSRVLDTQDRPSVRSSVASQKSTSIDSSLPLSSIVRVG